jgi:hypothetical protein
MCERCGYPDHFGEVRKLPDILTVAREALAAAERAKGMPPWAHAGMDQPDTYGTMLRLAQAVLDLSAQCLRVRLLRGVVILESWKRKKAMVIL